MLVMLIAVLYWTLSRSDSSRARQGKARQGKEGQARARQHLSGNSRVPIVAVRDQDRASIWKEIEEEIADVPCLRPR
jgi:flagellar biogenesis protein FliO